MFQDSVIPVEEAGLLAPVDVSAEGVKFLARDFACSSHPTTSPWS